jgi:hypothetical protein
MEPQEMSCISTTDARIRPPDITPTFSPHLSASTDWECTVLAFAREGEVRVVLNERLERLGAAGRRRR